jgi:hypothetical protein
MPVREESKFVIDMMFSDEGKKESFQQGSLRQANHRQGSLEASKKSSCLRFSACLLRP